MKFGRPFSSSSQNDISQLALYKDLAEFYFEIESVNRNFQNEIKFLLNIFPMDKTHKTVDLGCGTGEHVNELSKLGYDVIGLDISQQMLRIARKRFPKCRFILDDIPNLAVTGGFDAMYSLFGTMDYLLEDLMFRRALKGIYSRLRIKGKIIFDLWNSEPLRKIKSKPLSNVSSTIYNGKVLHRNRGFKLVESGSRTIVKVDYFYQIDDKEIDDCHYMRAFSLAEIEGLLKGAGFLIKGVFKNFKNEPFDITSNRIIIFAEKD